MSAAALLRFELATARGGRMAPAFAIAFAAAALVVSLVGLSSGGVITVQGFARTAVSLLQLVLWIVPLLALLVGAAAGADVRDIEFVAALPVTRRQLLLARWLAWWLVLAGALLVGLGVAGLVIGVLAGAADAARYLGLVGIALLLLGACLALGIALGVAGGARALAYAIVAWFVLVVGIDLAAIAVLSVTPASQATWGLSLLVLADPVDAARALGLSLLGTELLAGPTGAALRQLLGGVAAAGLLASLLAWILLPLAWAGRRLAAQDL